ncbi:hypothetical protein [Mycobacterium shigaense]|uniref:hypothetical protein n=1 Tax=Mycobacterium shigaense TaxID=722731 RepID=UPI000E585792|nr:hypothetical protein [Mycobacterium shigaense]
MGVVIENAHISGKSTEDDGGIDRLVAAGRACLGQSDDVCTLINVGVYRERNIVEPALAAIIQRRLGLGLRYASGRPPVLSFDLLNGPCGFLTAVQTVAALLPGKQGRCLVVGGDGHPAVGTTRQFPYAQVGAAALLRYTSAPIGFGRIWSGAGNAQPVPHGYVDLAAMGRHGRETISFNHARLDEDELVKLSVTLARTCLIREQASPDGFGLVIAQPFPGFAQRVAEELDVADVHAAPAGTGRDPHSAALIAAYSPVAADGVPSRGLLFLAAGAGPVAATSLYRRRSPVPSADSR